MKQPQILSVGEVLWDLFPEGALFGGAPANFTCHAALQGAESHLASAVGCDDWGREAVKVLQEHGVGVASVQTVTHAPTGVVDVVMNVELKPSFTIASPSAWDFITWDNDLEIRSATVDAIYFGTLGQRHEISRNTIRRLLDVAASKCITRFLDVNLRAPFYDPTLIRESVQRASIVKLSDEELADVCMAWGLGPANSPELVLRELLLIAGLDAVVMTRGKEGAVLVSAEETAVQSGVPIHVVDTVGAGDAFSAAFLLGFLRGEPAVRTLAKACRVAAATCAHAGAVPTRSSE